MAVAAPVRDAVAAYAESVATGETVAGPMVRLACQRHRADMEHGHERGLHFDEIAAQRVFDFFGHLQLAEGEFAGQPFTLQPWQKFIIGSLFGWKLADDTRRFRTAYIEASKGSGKSPIAAGVGLYGLVADGEAGAEVYAAATTRAQAGILFRDAQNMVKASPALARGLDVGVSNIAYVKTNSFFRPISSEARSLDGKRVHMALIDELHEHPNAAVLDKMSAGTKGRRQGLIFEITNSGYDRHSVCWEHHEMSRKVLEGTIENDEWFAYVCGLDESDSWVDESCWVKANPNLGVSIPVRYLRKQVAEAVGMPSKANIVQRLNFCIWTQQITRWIPLTQWDAAPPMRASLHGAAFGGLDLATTTDLAAFVRVFPDEDGGYDVQARFWCPEEGITQRSRAGVPYDQWARDGWIDATPGNVTDYSAIRAAIKQDADTCDLREIGYDRWNASQLVGELEEDGATMVPIGQGFASMNAPSKELERLIASGQIRHGGNPVLRWMISNVAAATDPAGNIKPDKQRSSEKIDGVVALVMALSRAVANAGGTGTSKYDTEGLMVFGGAWDEDEE